MTTEGPSLLSLNLWARRTRRFLAILERALQLLRMRTDLAVFEVDLNRGLYWCLLQASRELYPREVVGPSLECSNQPDPDDQVRAIRENKRPDIQWTYIDPHEPDAYRSSKQFVVECKRLGSPRPDWVLNRNYVDHGIWRFVAPEWSYAKRCSSAAMVGYWQDMQADDVLREVNQIAENHGLTALLRSREGWGSNGISRLEHTLNRPFPVSPLLLHHLWVDLRGKIPD